MSKTRRHIKSCNGEAGPGQFCKCWCHGPRVLTQEEQLAAARVLLQEWLEYAATVGIDPGDVPAIERTREFLEPVR